MPEPEKKDGEILQAFITESLEEIADVRDKLVKRLDPQTADNLIRQGLKHAALRDKQDS